MIPIRKRSIGVCILLSLITFGIYSIYWEYLLVKNIRAIKKDNSSCTGEMLCLIFVPFYSLYWWFTRGKLVRDECSRHGFSASSKETAFLVLALFGLEIVAMAIMQNDFNSLPSESTQSDQRSAKNIIVKTWPWILKGIGIFLSLLWTISIYFLFSDGIDSRLWYLPSIIIAIICSAHLFIISSIDLSLPLSLSCFAEILLCPFFNHLLNNWGLPSWLTTICALFVGLIPYILIAFIAISVILCILFPQEKKKKLPAQKPGSFTPAKPTTTVPSPIQVAVKVCPSCHFQNNSTNKFCEKCGFILNSTPKPTPAAKSATPSATTSVNNEELLDNKLKQMKKYKEMLDFGIISQEAYETYRADLLGK